MGSDSREIVFSSPRDRAQGAVWRIPVSGGTPRPLSAALRNASFPSISRQGKQMAFIDSWSDSNLYLRAGPGFPPAGMPGNLVHRWVWLFPHERTTARSFPQTENALHTSRIALVATRSGFHSVMAAMRFS